MWWLAILGLVITWAAVIARSFVRNTTKIVPADEVIRTERRWLRAAAEARAVSRDAELEHANQGLAEVAA